MNVTLRCGRAGLQTQLQDLGRPKYRHLGVPTGGAMDQFAAKAANWLVGNHLDGPVMEITMWGPRIEVSGPCQIAITGADLSPTCSGHKIELWATHEVKQAAELEFSHPQRGCRAYLAVRGQWQVSCWLGSCSPAPVDAPELTPHSLFQKGSEIQVTSCAPIARRQLPIAERRHRIANAPFRVLAAPEFEDFGPETRGQLLGSLHRIANDSNRMGYRLSQPIDLGNRPCQELISSAVVPGTIQIMPGGQPVILMRDGQTIGGYPRIAAVISADLDRLGQRAPGDEIQFLPVRETDAIAALRQQKAEELRLFESLGP